MKSIEAMDDKELLEFRSLVVENITSMSSQIRYLDGLRRKQDEILKLIDKKLNINQR